MYILRLALKAKVTNFSTQFYEEVNNKSSTQTENFQMFKLDLEKAEEPEIKLPTSVGSEKARELQKNFCFIDFGKASDCVNHKTVENSSRDGNTRPPELPPVKSVCRSRSNS